MPDPPADQPEGSERALGPDEDPRLDPPVVVLATPADESDPELRAQSTEEARARLRGALVRPSRRQWLVALLLTALGFTATVQVLSNRSDAEYAAFRTEDLVAVLEGLANASQRADQEIARLEADRDRLLTSTDQRRAAIDASRETLERLQILAGTVPVTGPGVVVTVSDPTGEVGINQMLNGVEELRDAGAEAIEISDQVRLVAQSSFEEGASGIVVDGVELIPPYTIEAVGDPETLAGGLDFFGGFVDDVASRGGEVEIEQRDSLLIESTAGIPDVSLAQPDAGE